MTVETALLYLSGRCDGAHSQDGQGFNGGDSQFGKSLAQKIADGYDLTHKQMSCAYKMLQKYRNQLLKGGIEIPNQEPIPKRVLVTPPPQSEPVDKTKPILRNPVSVSASVTPVYVAVPVTAPEYKLVLEGDRINLFSPYDPSNKFQSLAKSIKGKWDMTYRCWSFPDADLERVLETFEEYPWKLDEHVAAKINYLKAELKAAAQAKIDKANSKSESICQLIANAKLDQPLKNGWMLRDYQREGAEWLLTHSSEGMYVGGILADDMGTGKTIQALAAAHAMQQTTGCAVLVICPVSLTDNWLREAGYVGVTIECFSWAKVPLPLTTQKFIVIADEAHALQTSTSSRTKKFVTLTATDNCIGRWLLTGTPMKNARPLNLLPLLEIVKHKLVANKWEFMTRYCNARQKSIGSKTFWDFTGSSYLQELSELTTDIILRRTKKEVLSELPPKQRINVGVDLSEAEARAYKHEIATAVQSYRDRADAGEVDPDSEALVTLNILRKTGSMTKVPAVIERAQELLESGQQVVIFTEFLESAHALHHALGGELLTGATKERQELVDRFQSGESKVFVGTIRAGGVGITLTAASNLILVDRPWTPGDCHQAEDRCILEGTPILTPDGWKPIETISIGDLVIGGDGQPHCVTDAWNRGCMKTLTEVTVSGWSVEDNTLTSTVDHQWLLSDGTWKEAGDLKPGDKLKLPSTDNVDTIEGIYFPSNCRIADTFIGESGAEQRNGRLFKAQDFIDFSDETLFVFGYYVGDGFSRIGNTSGRFVSFSGNTTKKMQSLDRVTEWWNAKGVSVSKNISKDREGCEYRFFSGEWANFFHQAFGHGARKKHIPEYLMSLSREQSKVLLSGLMASDGYFRKDRYEYSTMSEKLASQVFRLILNTGFKPTVHRGSTGQLIISYTTKDIGQSASVKTVKHRFPSKSGGLRERVYDLTVDGVSTFVVGSAVVHNCYRMGQQNAVFIYWMQLGEIDRAIDSLIHEKTERIDLVLKGKRKTLRGLKNPKALAKELLELLV